ncbi:hypothetical protein N0V82_003457 [Gnomoniopsis sp. IMI 355080]|nr:hypothetical protein N0V82_003457 [Gnomoniopsis sp. IMI 355080]
MLNVLNNSYDFMSFDTFTEIFDWDSQSPSLQSPPANESDQLRTRTAPWTQDTGGSTFGGDHVAIPDTFNSLIHDLLDSTTQTQECLTELRPYLYFLWATFVGRISPFLTPFGSRVDNPLLKYLVPNAAKSTSLFVAILYFAQIIVGRRRQEPIGPEGRFVEDKAEDILRKLEENVSSEITTASIPDSTEKTAHSLVLTLSTTLVFCMGFLASQNAARLASHVEYAVLLCQVLFKTHADDEEFLYLAKLLGFIQITLLFTRRANSISAPDYLSAALEAQDDGPQVSLREGNEDLRHACTRFRDLDMFSGLSASMASILYTLGRLARAKHAGYKGAPESHAEFARAFESDIDGLETRLQRRLAVLLRHRSDPKRRMTTCPVGERPRVSAMARHLDAFNEAVFWSCWTIFYTDLKGRSVATDPDLATAVDSILDACAEIPKDSAAASLIFFPLMVGGIKSTKKVYREFVLARLECLDNIGVSDTRSLSAELIEKWWTSESASEKSNFLQNSVFRHVPQLLSSVAPSELHTFDDFNDDTPYEGIAYFAHLNGSDCFTPSGDGIFDIGIIGAPFDLGVTYRPGARFGPAGARMGARRLSPSMGYSMDHGVNPFRDWATVVDCGDISNTPFDKLQAIHELQKGWESVLLRTPKNLDKGGVPRLVSIGGDHTISLPAIRALHKTWGQVAVLHFDSHLDSWDPKQLGGGLTKYSEVTHGSMFHILHEEGLLSEDANMHLGSRSMLFDKNYDLEHDADCGFSYIRARELDVIGVEGVVERIVETVGDKYVYLSVDIDVLDPAFTPATGTIEPGGWTTRELLRIIAGLSKAGVKIVGSDVVEFTPVYDNSAETTAIAVAEIIYEILQWMIAVPVLLP